MTKLSKRGAMLRDLVEPVNYTKQPVLENKSESRFYTAVVTDAGYHQIEVYTYGEGTFSMTFVVDHETARRLILTYDKRDEPDPMDAVLAALDAAIKEADEGAASMAEIQERKDDEEAAILEEAAMEQAATLRKIRGIAAGAPADEEDAPRVFFTPVEAAALAKGFQFDIGAACKGEWPWYIVDEEGDDGEHDARAIESGGEWRIYFESAAEAINTMGL
jgi:hypothetical protein